MGCRDIEPTCLPDTVRQTVVALCADYSRRASLIAGGAVSRRTEIEFRYINFKILEAAEEIAPERDALTYIDEIGRRVGYAKSAISYIGERAYKTQKHGIEINIAKKLHLVD